MSAIRFTIEKQLNSGARAGVIVTPHGAFTTPAFCTVGTKATIKAVTPRDLKELVGAEVALANTYHLFLQPGDEVVRNAGGLGKFMAWEGPTVTDSGGYQVFSLGAGFGKGISKFEAGAGATPSPSGHQGNGSGAAPAPTVYDEDLATSHGKLAQVDDEGVSFTSHIDGSLHRFTPERSIEIQHNLGADIFFAFDECTAPTETYEYQREAGERTHRWALRSLKAHRQNLDANTRQAIFGIVQGGRYPDLRRWSATEIASMDFDGFGIGGSFSKLDMDEALIAGLAPLPPEKPRHFLGIGEPEDLFEGVSQGIDMFDCTIPTRLGRTGTLFTKRGKINILNEKYIRDFSPVDVETGGYVSNTFTKAYVAHLFRGREMLAGTLGSLHNLYFIVTLMKDIRQSILDDRFDEFRSEFLSKYLG